MREHEVKLYLTTTARQYITRDVNILGGRLCVANDARMPLHAILAELTDGHTIEEIEKMFEAIPNSYKEAIGQLSKLLENCRLLKDVEKITYHIGDNAGWFKRIHALQCSETLNFGQHRCQGTKGHDGNHWAYSSIGWYCWKNPSGAITGSTPPDHPEYIEPKTMSKKCYINSYLTVQVSEQEALEYLDKDAEI